MMRRLICSLFRRHVDDVYLENRTLRVRCAFCGRASVGIELPMRTAVLEGKPDRYAMIPALIQAWANQRTLATEQRLLPDESWCGPVQHAPLPAEKRVLRMRQRREP